MGYASFDAAFTGAGAADLKFEQGHKSKMAAAQTACKVLMVEPAGFTTNLETVSDNAFQEKPLGIAPHELQARALSEFNALKSALENAGVQVRVYRDYVLNNTPDSIFPNNWFSTHRGCCVIYPMKNPSRRRERRADIVHDLMHHYERTIDLSAFECEGKFLEGTGSLVLDRAQQLAFAAVSQRCTPDMLGVWAERLAYHVVSFHAQDSRGQPIYHTNIMMALMPGLAVVCLAAIPDQAERSAVQHALVKSERDVLELRLDQVEHYCANMLGLSGASGEPLIVMSDRALNHLDANQRRLVERHGRIVRADLALIEQYGGGSARCMIAELF